MVKLDKIEFYITNVCNLTCSGCNRFNDIKFAGSQRWEHYADAYEKWGRHVWMQHSVILGGEPLLNPTILDWIKGIYTIWPDSWHQVLTNGSYLDRIDGLMETCLEYHTWVGISKHRSDNLEALEAKIERYLGDISEKKYSPEGVAGPAGGNYYYKNAKGAQIYMWDQYTFSQSALITKPNGKYTLHNSDPEKAHSICPIAQHKSYHFIKGKLYKCGPVALFPELDEQFGLELSDEDKDVMRSYSPLLVDEFETRGADFLATINNVIPQCKFCPDSYNWNTIAPLTKGSKKLI